MWEQSVIPLFVILVVAVTAGCSGGESSQAEPTVQPSSSAEPREDPARDLDMRDDSPEEAIRAWFAANDHLQNTGDDVAFLSLSTSECQYCTDFATTVVSTYEAGGSASVPRSEVLSTQVKRFDGKAYYETVVDSSASTLWASPSAEPRVFSGGSRTYFMRMLLVPEGWRVDDVRGDKK